MWVNFISADDLEIFVPKETASISIMLNILISVTMHCSSVGEYLTSEFWLVNPDAMIKATPLVGSNLKDFRNNSLEIAVYYVGEGEAIVISKGTKSILVDGGSGSEFEKNDTLGAKLGEELSDKKLKAIVASHPHRDHTNFYHILAKDYASLFAKGSRYFDNDTPPAQKRFDRLERELVELPFKRVAIDDNKNMDTKNRVTGFAAGTKIYMLRGTTSATKDDSKKYWSIFMFVRYRNSWFLFTGDASKGYEDLLLSRLEAINPYTNVLKITHHGSEYGTSPNLVLGLRPKLSVASTHSDEGHRLEEVTKHTLSSSRIYATYEEVEDGHGQSHNQDIFVRTDGKLYSEGNVNGVLFEVETKPSKLM